jgi:hypothetical protein
MMMKLIMILLLTIHSHDNLIVEETEVDWKILKITKICSENGKQCRDELRITNDLKITYSKCGQVPKNISIPKELLDKVTSLSKQKVKEWDKEYYVDSVCGFNIELDNSENYSLDFDANPKNYKANDIQEYLKVLNDTFERVR